MKIYLDFYFHLIFEPKFLYSSLRSIRINYSVKITSCRPFLLAFHFHSSSECDAFRNHFVLASDEYFPSIRISDERHKVLPNTYIQKPEKKIWRHNQKRCNKRHSSENVYLWNMYL